MKKLLPLLVLLVTLTRLEASNPVITNLYTADPSGHVFNGRLYIYGSHDRTDAQGWNMTDYHVFSTDDLQNWSDHGVALDLAHVPWADSHLWAPDTAFKNGLYYFFFPAHPKPGENGGIGVATGTSPTGPFKAEPHPLPIQGIDPSIYLDDDGTGYVIWAGKGLQMAKMKPNLLELDGAPMQVQGIENFFEGPWLFKRNGIYYMTYPAQMPGGTGHGGNGQFFDYATAKSAMGPYTYQGHFSGTRPDCNNIHGSQFEWQGKWYCLYHDYNISEGCPEHAHKRSAMLDEMEFDADGKIKPLHWTIEGPAQLKPLDPFERRDATCLNQTPLPENPLAVTIEPNPQGGMDLGNLRDGAWVRYSGVGFGTGATRFSALVCAATRANARIELHLDSLDGPQIGSCPVSASPAGSWIDVNCPIQGARDNHFLYLKFVGSGSGELFKLASWQFSK